VTIAGQTGKVDEIELFTTRMITPDNRLIIIPNTAIFGSVIENITAMPKRRVDVGVGTDYSADLDQTRAVLEKVVADFEDKLEDPESVVMLLELGDSCINWQVRVWASTEDFWAVKQEVTRRVKMALDEAGIGIPFPQRDVNLSPAVIEAVKGRG
ncbi:MAG: mechanosensitive ion channel family protein, partial [Phycisphaerae bacterium]|nr:mechanosensitive ion channel family protein [Phycisphaerae bacterium]